MAGDQGAYRSDSVRVTGCESTGDERNGAKPSITGARVPKIVLTLQYTFDTQRKVEEVTSG